MRSNNFTLILFLFCIYSNVYWIHTYIDGAREIKIQIITNEMREINSIFYIVL